MDLISHFLTGLACSKIGKFGKQATLATVVASVLPDIGEIPIQYRLTQWHQISAFAVYDHRTSDASVAGNLLVTGLYDTTHSLVIPVVLGLSGLFIRKRMGYILKYLSLGWLLHLLLDFSTHGKVWALKLLFPLSNARFTFFADTLGNWWEWQPQFILPFLGINLPVVVIYFWLFLLSIIIWRTFRPSQMR